MNDEVPFEGPGSDDGPEAPYGWLDEWLCEYVDGTMDPSLETVFEQYVEANPELKAHVQRLRETRELLCNCGLPTDASSRAAEVKCRDRSCDQKEPSTAEESDSGFRRMSVVLGFISSVTVALLIGFLAGVTVTDSDPSTSFQRGTPSSAGAAATGPAIQVERLQPATGIETKPSAARGLQPVDVDTIRQRGPLRTRSSRP